MTVTTGKKRAANLAETAQKNLGSDHYWFTTFDEVTRDTVLSDPIWQVVGKRELKPLIE